MLHIFLQKVVRLFLTQHILLGIHLIESKNSIICHKIYVGGLRAVSITLIQGHITILLKIPPAGENQGRWSRIVLKRRAPSSCYNQIRRNRGAHLYCPRSASAGRKSWRTSPFFIPILAGACRHMCAMGVYARASGAHPRSPNASAPQLSLAGNLWSDGCQLGEQVKFAFVKEQRVFKKNYQLALVWWRSGESFGPGGAPITRRLNMYAGWWCLMR